MTVSTTLFETELFIGASEHELSRIGLTVSQVRPSDEEWFPWCIDVVFARDGEEDHERTVYGPSHYHCIVFALGHWREWVREILRETEHGQVFLFVDGEYRPTPPELAFATNDCISPEVEDKIAFADANGYHEEWDRVDVVAPELSKPCTLTLSSDFGQIQIFDDQFDEMEPPEWSDQAYKDFACFRNGALFLRVMENDDHDIEFELLGSEPAPDLEAFVHVVDAPFSTTGLFEVAEQPVSLPRGRYRVRWSVKSDKADSWKYRLAMWPGKEKSVSVLKRFEGS